MEGHKNKMTILVGKINHVNEENQKLNTMLQWMSSNHNDLQKHIRSIVQRKEQQTCVDRPQILNPDDQKKEKFNLRILAPRSVDVQSSSAVSNQSYNSWNCREQVLEQEGKKAKSMDDRQLPSKKRKINYIQLDPTQIGMSNSSMDDNLGAVCQQTYDSSDCSEQFRQMAGKNAKFMDDQQLPSKKRKINYIQLDQRQIGLALNSSMDDGLVCDKPPNEKHKALNKGSNKQTDSATKRIVCGRTRSDGSVIKNGAEPLFHLRTRA